MKLIKINNTWINPDFITSIIPTQNGSKVWVIGNAGYGTFEVETTRSPESLVKKITNHEEST